MNFSNPPESQLTAQGQSWPGTITFIMCLLINVGYTFAAPAPPQPLQPANGATNASSYPTLEISCNTSETAAAQYVIANDEEFSSIVYDSLESTNDVCSHFAFAQLSDNTQYYWHARIKNVQNEWSAWSLNSGFFTGTQADLFLNVFQDGTAGYSGTRDADMRGSAQNPLLAIREWDQGAQDVLRTGRRRPNAPSDEIYRSLIKFDLSALTDDNAVQNVYLEMTGHQHGQIAEWFLGHERVNSLYEVIRPWTEGNDIKDIVSGPGEVSWTYSERPIEWSIPGVAGASDTDPNADRKATHLLKFVTTNEIGYRTYWSSKALVDTIKSWIANPTLNQGVFFQADDESIQKTAMVASREHANQTFHPRLVIISTEQASLGFNQPPVAGRDSVTLEQGASASIPVMSNDIDHDGTPMPLFIESVDSPSHGSITIVGEELLYVPDPVYFGLDRFNYTISDGEDRSIGVVNVEVNGVPIPGSLPLTITFTGAGTGIVSSTPAGLTCPSICSAGFPENTPVELTATANPDSSFTGWSGAGCSGTGTCTVSMTQAESVTASFLLLPPPPPDTEAPLVSLVTPSDGETITGSVLLVASASDNVGVVGVQLLVDSTPIGPELTSAPWSISWNSASVTPGTHTLSAQARDAFGNVAIAPNVVIIVEALPGFSQDSGPDGLVVIEAEHFHLNTPQGNHSWLVTNPAGFSGESAMVTDPNSGTNQKSNYAALSPRLDYEVTFTQTGTHYVWIRGIGASGNDDSVHMGLDGQELTSSDKISKLFPTWTWSNQTDGPVATIQVNTPGSHTLNLWMREDGTIIDKIILTTNPAFPTPTGQGPAESTQGPPPPPDTEAPMVTMINPTEGQIVSGAVSLEATATDNVAVLGVQFLLNGNILGDEVTTAPWTMIWDTNTAGPGTYLLSAQGRDAADNITTTPGIMVEVEAPLTLPLTVMLDGTGNGWVSSVPTGLTCSSLCTVEFLENAPVELTATANPDSSFTGWSGAGCSGTGTCTVSMTQGESVTASFLLLPPPPPDTEAPLVSLVTPSDGETITGEVSLMASASDNVGVVEVQFWMDGAPLGSVLTSAPWSIVWDSTSVLPGTHTLSAQAQDATGNIGEATDVTVIVEAPSGFSQDSGPDGLVVIEAEHFHLNTPQGNHSWLVTNPAGFSGESAMVTDPNSGTNQKSNYAALSPRLDYEVTFTQTGTHYVWIRGIGASGNDDSVHMGLDGQELTSSDKISKLFPTWTWSNQTDGPVATIQVNTPGSHTLNLWMREDGTIIDKIILTTNPAFPTPTGQGPAESTQGPPPPPDTEAPMVTMINPTEGQIVSGAVSLEATATDNVAVLGVQFLLNGNILGDEVTTAPWTMIWDTNTAGPGTYLLSAQGRDAADNITTTPGIMVEVEAPLTLPLTVMLDGTGNGWVSSVPTGLTCSSLCTVEFLENAPVELTATANPDSSFTGWSGAGCSGTGTCTVSMTQGESVTASFLLLPPPPPDTEAPLVSLVTPSDGETITGEVSLMASASDNVGVVEVQFWMDGAPLGSVLTSAPWSIVWDSTSVLPGTHTLSAQAQDATGNIGEATDVTVIVEAPSGFSQDSGPDGLVVIEAEHFHLNTPQGNRSWLVTNPAGFSGESAMVTDPNLGTNQKSNYAALSPRLDYEVTFTQTGTHYVWIRGIGASSRDDSVHMGLDGQELTSSDAMSGLSPNWTWSNQTDGPVATIQVNTPGSHTLNLWMREDGTIIDKILLTVNPSYAPTGLGPTESPLQ